MAASIGESIRKTIKEVLLTFAIGMFIAACVSATFAFVAVTAKTLEEMRIMNHAASNTINTTKHR